ncbi:MAG TPA: metallophosphoesterase [Thermoanaerobaculia bacterium]|nr:metallophosphoesterase [Thermoanaerobaculia bacterium]
MKLKTPQAQEVRKRLVHNPGLLSDLQDLIKFLEASEYLLAQLMVKNKIWVGNPPTNPGGTGELEFGLIPYWVHNPPSFVVDFLDSDEATKFLWDTLELLLPAQIDSTNYNALIAGVEGQGLVCPDGTIYGTATYEQLDPGWIWSAINYLIVKYLDDRAPFSTTSVNPITLTGSSPDQVVLALVGDWGTGAYPGGAATDIMSQITGLNPDYIVHLGDVYYSGTGGDFLPLNEEQDNFLNLWPASPPSFTLNSNHEMYAGAKGYFQVALADSRFSQQKGTSYFALQYGGWTLLGLDSAYYSTAPLFMTGSIGGATGTQAQWIQSLGLSTQNVIVLTHHTGLTYDGSAEESLWGEVNAALGGDPAAWYWGHVHNGIIYNSPTVTGRSTLARCLGHGALPFGQAWGLVNDSHVSYYTNTLNPNGNGIQVYNGFVLLTITSSGTVTEGLYQQGTAQPIYTNSYSLPSAS